MANNQAEINQRIEALEADLRSNPDYVFAVGGGMVERLTPEEMRLRQLFEIVKMMAAKRDD